MAKTNSADSCKKQERHCRFTSNTEGRSLSHCCSGKAIRITYSECVSEALVIQYAPYYIVIYGLSGSNSFSHIIS